MAFRVAEEQAFIGGDGASEPMGIMEYNQNTLKMGIKSITTIDAGKLANDGDSNDRCSGDESGKSDTSS